MQDVKIEKCQYCGGEELIECVVDTTDRRVYASTGVLRRTALYAMVCSDCGSVVRMFCKTPEKIAPQKERKK